MAGDPQSTLLVKSLTDDDGCYESLVLYKDGAHYDGIVLQDTFDQLFLKSSSCGKIGRNNMHPTGKEKSFLQNNNSTENPQGNTKSQPDHINGQTDGLRKIHNYISSFINVTSTFMDVTGVLCYMSIMCYINSDECHSDGIGNAYDYTNSDECHSDGVGNGYDFIQVLKQCRMRQPKNLITCHLNINGISKKFTDITNLLTGNIVDMFFFSETKIDMSFPTAQFKIPGFKIMRADRNQNGGGIMLVIRSDIPCRRLIEYEKCSIAPIESLVVEIMIRKEKWLFICMYNPNKKFKQLCCETLENVITKAFGDGYSMLFVIGDLNINMLSDPDSKSLKDSMEILGLKNIIAEPTCHKSQHGSLIDVILSSNTNRVGSVINAANGISDFHNIIGFSTKIHVPRRHCQELTYRTYKHFDDISFRNDIAIAPYHVAEIFDDVDDNYWYHEKLISEIVNEHAPIKKRKPVQNPVPYINSKLRKAQHYKAMMRNKYFRNGRQRHAWELYRKSRNNCVKIKAQSIKYYFDSKCNNSENPTAFWKTIKPFISNKSAKETELITLKDKDDIISAPDAVSNIFNEYFCSVATQIGIDDKISETENLRKMQCTMMCLDYL